MDKAIEAAAKALAYFEAPDYIEMDADELWDSMEGSNAKLHFLAKAQAALSAYRAGGEAVAWRVQWGGNEFQLFNEGPRAKRLAAELTENGWLDVSIAPLFLHPAPALREALEIAEDAVSWLESIRKDTNYGFVSDYEPETEHPVTQLRARLTTLASAPTVSAWQPIETAPKDGTPILVYDGNLAPTDRVQIVAWNDGLDYWQSWLEGSSEPEPTHWMPLPSAPAASAPGVQEGDRP